VTDEQPATTAEVAKLPRSLKDKILESELGKNWRNIRWWTRQFTPTSVTLLLAVSGFCGKWIIGLSHKVDNQATKIAVLESQIVPDLKLAARVGTLERDDSNHEGRLQSIERAVGSRCGAGRR
jgi:hypothetical protein